jgi:RimJ/RimL family protein N-acetyltransferase
MNVQIVPVAESHIASFHACLDSVCREQKFLGKIEAKPLDQFSAWVQETIANDVTQFVAVDRSTVVGWCDIFSASSHAIRHRGTLGMGIVASHRGRGIGTQLLAACLAKARKKGILRIELEARADNFSAIKLYEKFGFLHETRKRNALRYDGVYYDGVQMSLIYEAEL